MTILDGGGRSRACWRAARKRRALLVRTLLVSFTMTNMFLKVRWDGESHFAELALVDVSTKEAMRLHVTSQFARLGTGVRAHHALVRFLTRMRTPVDSQVATVAKYLSAEFTRIVTTTLVWHCHVSDVTTCNRIGARCV